MAEICHHKIETFYIYSTTARDLYTKVVQYIGPLYSWIFYFIKSAFKNVIPASFDG